MRNFYLLLSLVWLAGLAAGGDAFDFGEMPPLPPPFLEEGAGQPPSAPPLGGALSPLARPNPAAAPAAIIPSAPGFAPPPPPPLTPPPVQPTAGSLQPPPPPPIAPPSAPPPDGLSRASLPGELPAASESVPPVAENPRPGKVSGGRVNVRAGPNTQYESVAVLTTGNPVTVLARHGEWYKIVFPADQLVSIHKNYVDAEITGDIPEAGVPGVVNQDKADVHAFYWDRSTMVGQLNKGDPVVIRQERGQWYRINAPDNARAYIFAEYVRVDGGREVAADSAPPPNNPAIDLSQGQPDATGRLKLSENDRRAAALKESYFKRVREQQLREEETVNRAAERVFSELEELERKIKEIDSEVASQIYAPAIATDLGSAAWAPPDPVYGGYTGWIENIGRMGGAPTSFRLSKGGEIRFHLRSEHFSLADFSGRRVWLNGGIEPSAGGNILNVEQIRPLSDQEILDSMRQTLPPLADGGGAAGYADSGGSGFPGQFPASPVIPSDPALLPDVVGVGQPGSSQYSPARAGLGSGGEVESDYYENPIVSDVAP